MITPKLDIFTIFIFLAVLQSLILTIYFYSRKERGPLSHITLSAILFCFALILFDIASGYSGYIVHYIYLNNFSDPLVFCLGPLCYLYTKSTAQGTETMSRTQYLHFIVPVFMLLYFTLYFMQPDALKYNDFLSAFLPGYITVYFAGFLYSIEILVSDIFYQPFTYLNTCQTW